MLRSWSSFQNIGPEYCSEPMFVGINGACASLDVSRRSPHLGLCSLLYSQFTTIVAASWANSVVDVVSATVRAKCQCWHFCFVMCTTFRCSCVRLSSFWMCHSCLLFLIVILIFTFRIITLPALPRRTTEPHCYPPVYHSSSSSAVQRWSWRSASISGLQPPSW